MFQIFLLSFLQQIYKSVISARLSVNQGFPVLIQTTCKLSSQKFVIKEIWLFATSDVLSLGLRKKSTDMESISNGRS